VGNPEMGKNRERKENQNTKLATTREFKHRDRTCQICIHAEEILQE